MKIKMNRETRQLQINRLQMLEIRKMDHHQLDGFLSGIYQSGAADGAEEEAVKRIDSCLKVREQAWQAFAAAIGEVKGIGEARRQELRLAFRKYFSREEGEENHE